MFGRDFVIQHVIAEYKRRTEEKIFRSYVCDVIKCVAEGWGSEVPYRYRELIEPTREEEKTGDEIAMEIIDKHGLKVRKNGNRLYETESEPVA